MSNLIPEGYYRAVARAVPDDNGTLQIAQWGKAKTGTRQVLVHFEVLDADHAGDILPWFGYFTDDTVKRTLESLRYCGWKGDDIQQLGPLDQVVSIKVEHNTHEGKTYARVAFVNRMGAGRVKLADPLSSDEMRQFAAMVKQSAQRVPEVEGKRADELPAAPSGNGSKRGGGSDHPFAPGGDSGGGYDPDDYLPF